MSPQRILLVEDNAGVRESMVCLLNSLDYEVIEAGDGTDALAALMSEDVVHLGIFDWNMPRMNGLILLYSVRASARWQHLPVIMMTGEPSEKKIASAFNAGANDFLEKPFHIETLQQKIEALLGKGEECHG